MQGQANHFVRYAPEKIEYGMKRYTNETKRLYGVIEKHLASGKEWLAADQYTIADMANFAWIAWHDWAGDIFSKLESQLVQILCANTVSLGCLKHYSNGLYIDAVPAVLCHVHVLISAN